MAEDYILFLFLSFALGGAVYAYWTQSGRGILVLVGIPVLVVFARLFLPQVPWSTQMALLLGYVTLMELWCRPPRKIDLSASEEEEIAACLRDDLFVLTSLEVAPDRVVCFGKFKTDRYTYVQQQLQSRLELIYPRRFYVVLAQDLFQPPCLYLFPVEQPRGIAVGLSRFLATIGAILLTQNTWSYCLGLLFILGGREWTRARVGGKLRLLPLLTMPGTVDFPIVGMGRGMEMPPGDRRLYFWLGLAPTVVGLTLSLLLLVPGWLLTAPGEGEILLSTWLGQSLGAKLQGLPPWGRAGWDGLMVTALGLLPIGFLEGGHLLHSVLGYSRAVLIGRISRVLFFGLCLSRYQALLLPALLLLLVDCDRLPALNDLDELPESYELWGIGMLGLGLLLLFPGGG